MACQKNISMLKNIKSHISANTKNTTYLQYISSNNLLKEKQSKPCIPLYIPPPNEWSEIKGHLYDRCLELYQICKEVLKNPFELYLFGSQIFGVSSSGKPDMDIWCICQDSSFEQRQTIVSKFSHKLDFTFIKTLPLNSKAIKLFSNV